MAPKSIFFRVHEMSEFAHLDCRIHLQERSNFREEQLLTSLRLWGNVASGTQSTGTRISSREHSKTIPTIGNAEGNRNFDGGEMRFLPQP